MENKIILNVDRHKLYWAICNTIQKNWIEEINPMWDICIPDINIPEQKKALDDRSIIGNIAVEVLCAIEKFKE